jgi:hypothetical protein
MATFTSLTQTETNEHHKQIFNIIAQHENESTQTQDGAESIVLDSSELEMIKDEQYAIVRDGLANDGEIQSVTELKESLRIKTAEQFNNLKMTKDGYFNPVSGIGVPFVDPGLATQSFIPVSITPNEATSYYANGGIPTRIIDKKAGCLLLDGMHFECAKLNPEDITKLEEYADKCGFTEAYREGVTQSLIFGGSAVYPTFKGDSPLMTQKSKHELLEILPEKDFIKYWITADRWNVVFVPDYNITAQDYLYARSIFVPLGGCRVNTQRVAMIKPRKLPFWGAIRQMGWSTSDFEGWIKDYESYEIMKASLPIMAQQMSLMYHTFPADGMIIENGPEYAKQFFKQNEKEMREWSILHPKAINSIGEIKVIERSYSGFQQLISEARLALCSGASVPESILFAEKASGLASDNKDDITLKQSEAIRLLFNNVAPSFQNCIEFLVYSCFGKNSEQAKYAREVKIAADNGVILSDMEKAQLGSSFTQIIGGLVSVGVPLKNAADIASKFVPSAELNEENMASFEQSGESQGLDSDLWNQINGGGIPQNQINGMFGGQNGVQ